MKWYHPWQAVSLPDWLRVAMFQVWAFLLLLVNACLVPLVLVIELAGACREALVNTGDACLGSWDGFQERLAHARLWRAGRRERSEHFRAEIGEDLQ